MAVAIKIYFTLGIKQETNVYVNRLKKKKKHVQFYKYRFEKCRLQVNFFSSIICKSILLS